jgi:hypothetical protein
MIASFRIKSVYGQNRAYPVNQTATLLLTLLGSKTLLPQAMDTLGELGYYLINADSNQPIDRSALC